MTILVVQCRLSSTRLPGKALLPLGNSTVLDWTLAAMKKVPADEYYLATDSESCGQLAPVAKRNGFNVFEGPLDLLLHLIEKNKFNIFDIPIVDITEQYLEYELFLNVI